MIKQIIVILTIVIVCSIAVKPFNNDPPERKSKITKFLEESEKNKQSNFRLPRNTAPRLYKIELDPNFEGETFTFKGNSTVIFEVLQPTTSVILHKSYKVTIERSFTELIDDNGVIQKPKEQEWKPSIEFYTITFEQTLEPGNYTLKMKWTGRDAAEDWFDQRMGFFRAYDTLANHSRQ